MIFRNIELTHTAVAVHKEKLQLTIIISINNKIDLPKSVLPYKLHTHRRKGKCRSMH
jgi:hypothetical protein